MAITTIGFDISARAKGVIRADKQAGVTRASFYKSLMEGGSTHFDMIKKTFRALGSD